MILLLLIWMHASSFIQAPQGQIPAGDADGDGFLSLFDLDTLLDAVLAKEEAPGDADFNGDGQVNVADLAGLRDYFFPSDPNEIARRVEVELADHTLTPGQELEATWTVRGMRDFSGLETVVRLVEPGTALVTEETNQVTPGSAPANGAVYYRAAGDWAQAEGVFSAGQKEGELDSAFPADLEGEWRLEVELRREEETLASGSASLLRSSGAAIHLSINRTLANRLDRVEVDLMTAAGEEEQEVALAAVLILPDESQLILPGLFEQQGVPEGLENPVFLARGVLEDSQVELLNRYLGDFGEGLYQVSVKMNDLESGSLLALASASFQVCDTPARVTGTVTEGGQPLGGEGTRTAGVSAEDLDDGFVTAQAGIGEDGSYQLELVPGRYRLTAAVADAEGVHLGEFGEIVTIGCEGEGQEANIETELVSEVNLNEVETSQSPQSVAADRRIVPQQGGGSIPMPAVVVWFGYSGDSQYQQDAETSYNTNFRPVLNVPGVIFGFGSGGRSDYSMDVGMSGQEQDDQGKFKYEVKLHPICGGQSRTLVSQERSGSSALAELSALAIDAVMAINQMPNLAQDLDTDRFRPVAPKLDLQNLFPTDRPARGATIAPLLKVEDSDGTPQVNTEVSIHVFKDFGGGTTGTSTLPGETDAQGGVFDPDLLVQDELWGEVAGVLDRCGNPERSNSRYYYVHGALPSNLRLVDPPPPYEVMGGDTVEIRLQIVSGGAPGPGEIQFVAFDGSVSPERATTPPSLIVSTFYTAPMTNGPVFLLASEIEPDDTLVGETLRIDFMVTGEPEIEVDAGGSPQPLPTTAGLSRSPQGSQDVLVTAGLRIGEDRVENQPVVFSLQGPGQLTSTNGQTDEFGVVTTGFIPPDTDGTTTVTGTSIVNGVTVSDSVDIEYEKGVTVEFLGLGITASGLSTYINNLGEVLQSNLGQPRLWLPTPAYGLPQGRSPLPLGEGRGLNDLGQVLGWVDAGGQNPREYSVWKNGAVTKIPGLEEPSKDVLAINNQGQITGFIYDEENEVSVAFLGSVQGNIVKFGQVGDVEEHIGYALNDQGNVVAEGGDDEGQDPRSLIFFEGSTGSILRTFDEGISIQQASINNSNEILVVTRTTGSPERGTLLVRGEQITQLRGLDGSDDVEAWRINDAGVIVGEGPAIWVDGQPKDVNDLIPDEVFSGRMALCGAINNLNQIVCSDLDGFGAYVVSNLPIDGTP